MGPLLIDFLAPGKSGAGYLNQIARIFNNGGTASPEILFVGLIPKSECF
jgi:hypothetical protein